MKNKFITIIAYILIFFNSNLQGNENNNILKVGLLAPLSGEYKELGDSLLYSLQLALDEINDKNVQIIPRDSGSNDKKKLIKAIQEIRSQGVNIVIGPINNEDFDEVKKSGCFIVPSHWEPWGVVVHEFGLAGLPLILSNKVGARSTFLIDNYNGYTFKSKNNKSLQDAMLKIMNSSDKSLLKMGPMHLLLDIKRLVIITVLLHL